MGKKLTFDYIREHGMLLYEYIRGSKCQGLDLPTSDTDYGGVYICNPDELLGLGINYEPQVENDSHDIVWYELNRFVELLTKSNPTVLEALFVDDEFVVYEHPIITELKKNKNMFLTQAAFPSFYGYSVQQIRKAQGLNKKIVNPVYERLGLLDFCYTFYRQGSSKIKNWLDYRNLNQRYCGLINIPNMKGVFGVYYDWKAFFEDSGISANDLVNVVKDFNNANYVLQDIVFLLKDARESNSDNLDELEELYKKATMHNMVRFILDNLCFGANSDTAQEDIKNWYFAQPLKGYRGIVKEGCDSQEVRLSSILKGDVAICNICYNRDGYGVHCKEYNEYKKWEAERNPERFRINVENGRRYDSKNMCASCRLLNTAVELARDGVYNVNRRNIDRDFLLDVKLGKMTYEYLIDYLVKKKAEMEEAIKTTKLPEKVDVDAVNNLLIKIRHEQLSKA